MRRGLRAGLLLILTVPCVGCDQASKSLARTLLAPSGRTSLLDGVIIFEYAENPGGFLSIGAGLPDGARFLIFTLLTGALMAVLLALSLRNRDVGIVLLTGLALATSGGVGNLIDRISNDGRVVDFVSLGIGPLRTGIFNMADLEIMAGAAILLAGIIMHKKATKGDA